MENIISIFGDMLSDSSARGQWDARCCLCGERRYTEIAHNVSSSDANIKIFGKTLIDMPIVNIVPSCRECNSGIHNGYARKIKHFPPILATIARDAWIQFYNRAISDPKIKAKIEKIGGII